MRIPITESGIFTADEVGPMRRHGVHAFLDGRTFMHADEARAELASVFSLTEPLFNKSY
jgi:indole-3-glycerol phosphate synthase